MCVQDRRLDIAAMCGMAPAARERGRRLGRRNHLSGASAEDQVARVYQRKGAQIRDRRCRTPEGELDIVTQIGDILIFVEVKKRKNVRSPDAPVSARQWQRLESAALHYMMQYQKETGVQPVCRFDVALTGRDGAVEIIENARSFDAY